MPSIDKYGNKVQVNRYQSFLRKKDNGRPRSQYSSSKSTSKLSNDFSFSKSNGTTLFEQQIDSSLSTKSKKFSYVSPYSKESRFDKIMKLKINPIYLPNKKQKVKKSVLNSSFSSIESQENKENHKQNKSRLQKIMNIKVVKPKVNSTLANYKPYVESRPQSKQKESNVNSFKQYKECTNNLRKLAKQEEKEDRLWKLFQRERQMRLKEKKMNQKRQYDRVRRKQKKFQSIVHKQIRKIQKQRQAISKHNSAFSSSHLHSFY